MIGIDANTGQALGGVDHLRQSIRDILTTPVGTRVMRRAYGSRLYRLVDQPMNRSTLLDMYMACAEALATWEPRVEVQKVTASELGVGRVVLALECIYLPSGEPILLDGIVVQ